jgi:putative spermidine/putrescine transport system ATP-binding protein
MAAVAIDQATKRFGDTLALDEICLDVRSGEFVTLLGPSGCGKTTMLRAIAGLATIDRGSIAIAGRGVTRVPVNQRNIGMVFQNLALFPHLTVAENVAFGLKMRGAAKAERRKRVADALALVRLVGFDRRYPYQLSGGQQQRVAIARALVIDPAVLLLDEPFAALDRKLREEMQIELRDLTRRVGITAIFVTHDQEEALTLSDRIAVMNAGRIEQVGSPDEVYSVPETRFAADFMGARNILEARVIALNGATVELDWSGIRIRAKTPTNRHLAVEQAVAVTVRPELIRTEWGPSPTAPNSITGRVLSTVDQGAFATLRVAPEQQPQYVVTVRRTKVDQAVNGIVTAGAIVSLSWEPQHAVLLFDQPRGDRRASERGPDSNDFVKLKGD